jgi:hypothetical protein
MTRKSFVLHVDSLDVLDELTNEQAGMLFKAMRSFHIEDETELDTLTKIVFSPFKNQFNRDSLKYKTTCERRAAAGSMGGKQKVANASKPKQKVANLAESDNVSKSKSKSKSKSESDSEIKDSTATNRFDEFWSMYNKKVDRVKCEKKFAKLKQSEVLSIFFVLPQYIQSTPDPQYRKNPLTWLNGNCWKDEAQKTNGLSSAGMATQNAAMEWISEAYENE